MFLENSATEKVSEIFKLDQTKYGWLVFLRKVTLRIYCFSYKHYPCSQHPHNFLYILMQVLFIQASYICSEHSSSEVDRYYIVYFSFCFTSAFHIITSKMNSVLPTNTYYNSNTFAGLVGKVWKKLSPEGGRKGGWRKKRAQRARWARGSNPGPATCSMPPSCTPGNKQAFPCLLIG